LLKNAKLKTKLFLVLSLPIAGLLFFSLLVSTAKYRTMLEVNALEEFSSLAVKMSATVHEIQKERGMSSGYLGSAGVRFGADLKLQRVKTDAKIKELMDFVGTIKAGKSNDQFNKVLSNAISMLDALGAKRTEVDAMRIRAADAVIYYTGINTEFLDAISYIPSLSSNIEVANAASAYVSILYGKEKAGQERALLSKVFSEGSFAPGVYDKFIALVAEQNLYFKIFEAQDPIVHEKLFNDLALTLATKEVERMRAVAVKKAATGNFGIDPVFWFGEATERIDGFKLIEDSEASDLVKKVADIKSSARNSLVLYASLSFIVILVVIGMAFMMALKIIRPIKKLSDALAAIAGGNLDAHVDVDSRDEIGMMGGNFNAMATELKKQRAMLTDYGNELRRGNEDLKSKATALRQRDLESSAFSRMGEMLHACQAVEEAANVISGAVQIFFPHESGAIFLFNASRNILESIKQWGKNPPQAHVIGPNDCWGLRRGRHHLVALDNDPRCPHALDAPLPYICIPMSAQGETLGMLYLHLDSLSGAMDIVKDIAEWSGTKEHLILRLAENAGLAITNLKLREKLRNLSVRDPLTGLFNRRYMSEALELERQRGLRSESTIGVLMIDIDHFKRFNDTFGHDAGDTVLKELGLFLQKSIRGGDIACRYGGEEFTIIMPGASIESAKARANILVEGARHINVSHKGQSLGGITLSIGVAILPEHGADADTVIQAADAALYRAKEEGRDRVCTAGVV
jgi:diguanylate cyclase (GGDEF)-like protein